jgi:pectate lyase
MKKTISIILVVTMLVSMLLAAIPASAAEALELEKVGNKIINDTNRAEYVASLPAGAIAVASKSDLIGQVQNDKYYYLTANITFGEGEYAMGVNLLENATIDGCGYTVTIGGTSLFGKTKNLTVKNLTIEGAILPITIPSIRHLTRMDPRDT